jgi:hypothetical protein
MKRIKLTRQDLINDKMLAFQMWVKRWSDMALLGIEDRTKEALMMIRKISRECEEIE